MRSSISFNQKSIITIIPKDTELHRFLANPQNHDALPRDGSHCKICEKGILKVFTPRQHDLPVSTDIARAQKELVMLVVG